MVLMGVNIVRKLRVLNSACVLLSNYDLDLRPLAFNLQQVTLAGSAGSWAYLINCSCMSEWAGPGT